MAAVSTPQAQTSLTPPSSSHGQDSWNYSVPAQVELSHSTNDYHHNRQTSHPNGYALRPSTETFGPRPTDSNHLAPARLNALNRQDSSISDTGSAPDSLLDLYGNNKSGQNNMDPMEGKGVNGGTPENEDAERSRWIHRDKLARIESAELQAAGITLPRPRTESKSSRRERSRDQGNGVRSEGQKRQKMGAHAIQDSDTDGSITWDLRLPEEAAEHDGEYSGGSVKGLSRIPISKTSPLPIPIDYLERDTPIPRKPSGGWYEDESSSFSKARSRSHSIKSSFALDDASTTQTTAPIPIPSSAPVRSETSPTKKPAGRKTSVGANSALTGSRQTSAQRQKQKPSSDSRPKTRSGEGGSVSKRPEGDPPWLASMYKPDPRLPPDQQVIPTHAKRMQQEQWEKEGKFGNVYDTSFRPLNHEEFRSRPNSYSPPLDTPEVEESKPEEPAPAWPLPDPKSSNQSPVSPVSPIPPVFPSSPKSPTLSGRSQSGYSTMPRINTGKSEGPNNPDPKPPSIRLQDAPESDKKGCGCCVIM